jgi:prolyl 4-hydroxylase
MIPLYIIGILIIIIFIAYVILLIGTYKETTRFQITAHRSKGYHVLEIHGLLSPEECDSIRRMATAKGLEESMVWNYGQKTGNTLIEDHRKSKQCWLDDKDGDLVLKISKISETLTGIPLENQEMLQVAMYEPGGKFNEHFDACDHDDPDYCAKMNHNAGQRRSTLIIYLNDDFEGGETEFVNVGIKIKPVKGKAILFWNTDNNETVIVNSRHRGCDVKNGEKWICTKWNHAFPYPKYL